MINNNNSDRVQEAALVGELPRVPVVIVIVIVIVIVMVRVIVILILIRLLFI